MYILNKFILRIVNEHFECFPFSNTDRHYHFDFVIVFIIECQEG